MEHSTWHFSSLLEIGMHSAATSCWQLFSAPFWDTLFIDLLQDCSNNSSRGGGGDKELMMNDGTNEWTEGNQKRSHKNRIANRYSTKCGTASNFFRIQFVIKQGHFFRFSNISQEIWTLFFPIPRGFSSTFFTFCIWFFYTSFRTYIFWFLGIPSHLFFLPAKGHLKNGSLLRDEYFLRGTFSHNFSPIYTFRSAFRRRFSYGNSFRFSSIHRFLYKISFISVTNPSKNSFLLHYFWLNSNRFDTFSYVPFSSALPLCQIHFTRSLSLSLSSLTNNYLSHSEFILWC